jgi:hypothetical protein
VICLLALGMIVIGVSLDARRRQNNRSRPDLNRWEDEGGAVPVSDSDTAAQTQHG